MYPLAALADSAPFRERTRRETALLWKELGLRKGSALLDVCCGVGRHAVPLAKRGAAVTGADISGVYLAEARRAARRAGARLEWARRDMRRLGFRDRFDAACNMFSSFGYFAREADDLAALRSIRAALKPGGLLLLDTINGRRLERILRFHEEVGLSGERWAEMEDGTLVLEEPRWLPGRRAVETDWVFLRGGRRVEMSSFFRLYDRARLAAILRRAGLRPLRFFGDADGSPYSPELSQRLIAVARKPELR